MATFDSTNDLLIEVAKASDYCLKPWRHSVINNSVNSTNPINDEIIDLTLIVECRDKEGQRFPENDLEIEIYRSGVDLNFTFAWRSFPEKPILWQGKHSLWMDSLTGKRSQPPEGGSSLEALARRLRASFSLKEGE